MNLYSLTLGNLPPTYFQNKIKVKCIVIACRSRPQNLGQAVFGLDSILGPTFISGNCILLQKNSKLKTPVSIIERILGHQVDSKVGNLKFLVGSYNKRLVFSQNLTWSARSQILYYTSLYQEFQCLIEHRLNGLQDQVSTFSFTLLRIIIRIIIIYLHSNLQRIGTKIQLNQVFKGLFQFFGTK